MESNRPLLGRRSVIRAGAAAGLAAVLAGCADLFDDGDESSDADTTPSSDAPDASEVGSVVVVGAGPAGMSAAALLARAGVDVRVLEAQPTYGGRIRHTRDFADFPIPLGGEWLHEDVDELGTMVGRPEVVSEIEMAAYRPSDDVAFYDGALTTDTMGDEVDGDLKFVGSSWLGFFETYVLPDIADRITYGVEIVRVQYSEDDVVLTDADGTEYAADRAVVTVPLKLLQEGRVEFDPPLPPDHQQAIDDAEIWGGMKVFVEFTERFYPVFLAFPDSDTPDGQRLYYDAAYGQESEANILGLFAVGAPAERYQVVDEADELRDLILGELDEIFGGVASRTYVKHIAQNWNDEPFARAAYLADDADWRIPPQLQERFSDRVLLAGDAYTSHDDWSAVDDAARSARDAVRDLLR